MYLGPAPQVGQEVTLKDEPDCIIPAGTYVVSKVNPDNSFHVGGNTAVWPRRIEAVHQSSIRVHGPDAEIRVA